LNAAVSVIQESSAESAVSALKKLESVQTRIQRNGQSERMIDASELVVGDIITLFSGQQVPADCRILCVESNTHGFLCDQSMLTGESEAVEKVGGNVNAGSDVTSIQDQINMVFSGTVVLRGRCKAVVCATGNDSIIGSIRADLLGIENGDFVESNRVEVQTPMQRKLGEFGEEMSRVILILCALIWVVNIGREFYYSREDLFGGALYYLKTSVALAVAAVPEGLPAIVTSCLALGASRMAKLNAIIRHLPSVETLGSTQVIATDKTGTLTANAMSVSRILVPCTAANGDDEAHVELQQYESVQSSTGSVYATDGMFQRIDRKESMHNEEILDVSVLNEVAMVSTLCSDAVIDFESLRALEFNHHVSTSNVKEFVAGESTELALCVLSEKVMRLQNTSQSSSELFHQMMERVFVNEFSRDRRSMSALYRITDETLFRKVFHLNHSADQYKLVVKGAPENVLERCTYIRQSDGSRVELNEDDRESILKCSWNGLRRIALAVRDEMTAEDVAKTENVDGLDGILQVESHLTFVGMVGIRDPPRFEVKQALKECQQAGIRVIVITGDNQYTAQSICRELEIIPKQNEQESEDDSKYSMTGREFRSLSENDALNALDRVVVFSRAEPADKLLIVKLLQKKGFVTAMTGDGVNDGAALRRADIGIAMGSGTEVAKCAADMILSDDNFVTIVHAVKEGRAVYSSVQKLTRYLISSNIGEVAAIAICTACALPDPFLPVQLLWCNLVTDGLPAAALSFNPPEPSVMNQPPRNPEEPLANRWQVLRFASVGLYCGIATFTSFLYAFLVSSSGPHLSWNELMQLGICYSNGQCTESLSALEYARSVALSTLVMVEMFNVLNSVSEKESILTVTPFQNRYLLASIMLSISAHCCILYIPLIQSWFNVQPISITDWLLIIALSSPVILLEELLKIVTRKDASCSSVTLPKFKNLKF